MMQRGRGRLADLGEFGFIKKLLPKLYWPGSLKSQLWVGPGDDAGVLGIKPGNVLVATTDCLVQGVHFETKWFPARDLGEKLLAVNLSDLAAMGKVRPLAVLVTVALPGDTPVNYVDNLYIGLKNCAQRWKIGFLGGDTVGSRRDRFVSATVLGEANPLHLVRRSGAQPGDILAAVGPLGLAAAGLDALRRDRSDGWTSPLIDVFRRPQPQLRAGAVLGENRWASSMTDASDGLEASVKLLSEASKLGACLELDRLPVPMALSRFCARRKKDPIDYFLRGGEDYALIFTVRPNHWRHVQRALPDVYPLGHMVAARQGRSATYRGKRFPLESYGYAHF